MNDSEAAAAAGKKMAEAEYKINTHAHVAGLKRLSARANAGPNNNIHSIPRKVSFSFNTYGRGVIEHLRNSCGVRVRPGLTSEEFEKIEARFQFTFPPDLRGILQEGLPLGVGFPDWRSGGWQKLSMWINMPKLGLCSAVERGEFWWKRWGARPADAEEAVRIARAELRKVPVLIPVYGQCYVPASSPTRAGNPVLFVDELNVYYCGLEVSDLFHKESFVAQCCSSRGSSSVYVPEPMSVHDLGSGRGSLEGARRLIARCSSSVGQEKPMSSDRRKAEQLLSDEEDEEGIQRGWLGCTGSSSEAWGRSLDALGRHSDTLSSRKSNSSARSVLTGARSSYGSRSSDGSLDDSPRFNASSSEEAASSRPRSRGFRRIEFWSNMIEKGQSMNVASGARANGNEIELGSSDEFLQLHQEQQQQEEEDHQDQDCCLEAELKARVNASQAVTESIKDMTSKLRKAGWNEADIAEIMDAAAASSSSCSDHHSKKKQQLPDRQTVLEGLALQLDFLSACLRKAGWSVHDVAETLCFDLEHHRRPRTNVSPEVAARIGILAAFVAQG